jgi:predicted phosphoribosyltransferase
MTPRFRDRRDAGRRLARKLSGLAGAPGLLVLALPRGGLPVGLEVARALQAPLDVYVVRKLGLPGQEELAMGAVASGGVSVLNEDVVSALRIRPQVIESVLAEETAEVDRREREYRGGRPPPSIEGRTIVLVDDGLATGSTMRAAISALRRQRPARIVVAVPVGAPEVCAELRDDADEVVCVATPEPFDAIGLFYADFSQTTHDEVREILASAAADAPERGGDEQPASSPAG